MWAAKAPLIGASSKARGGRIKTWLVWAHCISKTFTKRHGLSHAKYNGLAVEIIDRQQRPVAYSNRHFTHRIKRRNDWFCVHKPQVWRCDLKNDMAARVCWTVDWRSCTLYMEFNTHKLQWVCITDSVQEEGLQAVFYSTQEGLFNFWRWQWGRIYTIVSSGSCSTRITRIRHSVKKCDCSPAHRK